MCFSRRVCGAIPASWFIHLQLTLRLGKTATQNLDDVLSVILSGCDELKGKL